MQKEDLEARQSAVHPVAHTHPLTGRTALFVNSVFTKGIVLMKLPALIGGIALPNDASVRLHEKLGFEKVSHLKRVGFKFERWIDVGHWQLERPEAPSCAEFPSRS